jgi:hypothetical protein
VVGVQANPPATRMVRRSKHELLGIDVAIDYWAGRESR